MPPWLWLAIHAACAVTLVHWLRRSAIPTPHRPGHAPPIEGAATPLVLLAPMLCCAWHVVDRPGASMHTVAGWLLLGAPVFCALAAMGIAIAVHSGAQGRNITRARSGPGRSDAEQTIEDPCEVGGAAHTLAPAVSAAGASHNRPAVRASGSSRGAAPRVGGLLLGACMGAGIVLVLLAAANDLTLWGGQFAFACGAALLWINAPQPAELHQPRSHAPTLSRAAVAIGCIACIGQCVAVIMLPRQLLPVSGALIVATASAALAVAARTAGPENALRLGLWIAALGVPLGIGAIALLTLAPAAYLTIRGEYALPVARVATRFGTLAPEGVVLAALAGFNLPPMRLPRAARLAVGGSVIVAAATFAAWRLASLAT